MPYYKLLLISLFISSALTACGQVNSNKINENNILKLKQMQDETLLKPVRALIEAMEAENAELIRAQFSEKATQAYGADGKMKTPEETKKWIESDIISRQGKVANPEFTVISKNEVVVKGQYSSHGYTNKANFLFTVENGKITSWRMRY